MADYYQLITRAVADLPENTDEARRALYDRARNALVTQLRGQTPALSESEVTRERRALDDAIGKAEAERTATAHVGTIPNRSNQANDVAADKRVMTNQALNRDNPNQLVTVERLLTSLTFMKVVFFLVFVITVGDAVSNHSFALGQLFAFTGGAGYLITKLLCKKMEIILRSFLALQLAMLLYGAFLVITSVRVMANNPQVTSTNIYLIVLYIQLGLFSTLLIWFFISYNITTLYLLTAFQAISIAYSLFQQFYISHQFSGPQYSGFGDFTRLTICDVLFRTGSILFMAVLMERHFRRKLITS